MYCDQCGKKIDNNSRHCPFCGVNITKDNRILENNAMSSNKNKLILPISILLACLILGGFYFASQISKQKSIEKQQALEIAEKRKIEDDKLAKETREKQVRQDCYDEAIEASKNLLETKAGLPGGARYEEAVKKGLYLKDDFDKHFEDCLSKNGINK